MSELDVPRSDDFTTIPDNPVAPESNRVDPGRMSTGTNRGSQVVLGSDGVPQVLSGIQKTFGPGFYVAASGVDAVINTNAANWIFNSNQNIFKIAAVVNGTYTITATDATNSYANFSFAHGLSTKPTVVGSFVNSADGVSRQLPYFYQAPTQSFFGTAAPGASDHVASATVQIYSIDSTSINMSIKVIDISGTAWILSSNVFTFKFYCLQETIV